MVLPEIGTYLVANGVGTALGTDVFLGKLPPTPDVIVVLIHYASLPDEPDLGTGNIRLEFPRVQLLCRGIRDDYAGPMLVAQTAKIALVKVQNQSLSGTRYLAILPESGPFFLRRDDNDRIEIVTNYQVSKVSTAS